MPEAVGEGFNIGEAPHFRLHHVIDDEAVFALRFGPCTDHGGLCMWVAGEVRCHCLGVLHGQGFIKECGVGCRQGVEDGREVFYERARFITREEVVQHLAPTGEVDCMG